MNSALMFSKASDEWTTPQLFYDALHAEFTFGVDAAATPENRKCDLFYGNDERGGALARDWTLSPYPHWCNPPYSRCAEFVAKAYAEMCRGVLTVMLIPARTDTRYFHGYLWDRIDHKPMPGVELRFVRGRLKFGDGKNSAPFPSMVVVFRP